MDLRKMLREWFFIENGTCPVCGRVLFLRGQFLCSRCGEDLPLNRAETCKRCGRPMNDGSISLCADCARAGESAIAGGFTWLSYDGGARQLIHAMKFGSRRELCRWSGREMAPYLAGEAWIGDIDAVTAVPLHPKRQAERGYNQSALVAEGLAQGLEAHGIILPVLEGLLIRRVETPHQVGLSREARLENLRGAFAVTDPTVIAGRTLLLIDDVLTTGSTLRECAQTLTQAGARRVYTAVCGAVPGR
jgi:competence protein ComFC